MKFRALFLLALVLAMPAKAYVDPNIGGQIYQAIYPLVALILGAVTFAREWIALTVGRIAALLRDIVRPRRGRD